MDAHIEELLAHRDHHDKRLGAVNITGSITGATLVFALFAVDVKNWEALKQSNGLLAWWIFVAICASLSGGLMLYWGWHMNQIRKLDREIVALHNSNSWPVMDKSALLAVPPKQWPLSIVMLTGGFTTLQIIVLWYLHRQLT